MNAFAGRFLAQPPAGATASRSAAAIPAGSCVLRKLDLDEPRLKLALDVDTIDACFHRDGPRSLLALGLSFSAWGMRSPAEAAELVTALVDDARRALLRLRGGWVLLFVDESRNRCLLATDRAATRSACFAALPDRMVFGLSALEVMRCDPRLDRVRPQAIFDYLRSHFIPAPETIFAGVERLVPGEYVDYVDGRLSRSLYWEPRYGESAHEFDFAKSKAEFRRLLEDGVRAEAASGTTGAFLSGGTDSSTIAGMLCRVTGEPANTYSIGFDVRGFDEMEYARIAAKHFGTHHHEYYITPDDLVQSIPKVAAAFDQPFGNSSALPAYYCASLAHSDGIAKMLGGDGGDELFGGNTRYAKQKIFDIYHRTPAWLRSGLLDPALLGMPVTQQIPLLKKARSYIEQAKVPMPARLHTYNLLDRIGIERIFTPAFMASVDITAAARREYDHYAHCTAKSLVDQMLCYDWKYTLADNDLPKVVGTCNLARVGIGFPMLNEELAAFANGLQPEQKVKGLQLRHFFKAALQDFLPPQIIAKRKHGFGLPFGSWLVKHDELRRLSFQSLESLRTRGIVRSEFFDELLQPKLQEHASYYGELVWVMMMLEQWLQAYRSDYVHTA
ncbi:MAG: asparagine synthase-related protein [Casimicrobiaceae bacterium]